MPSPEEQTIGTAVANARTFGIVVCSTRSASGIREDKTGPLLAAWAFDHGYEVVGPHVVPDGPPVERALTELLEEKCSVIVTTGGTGFSSDDVTPEITSAILDRPAPGITEEIRRRGLANTPLSPLSRGVAGVSGKTFVVNLAGSTGAVRDGLEVLEDLLHHVLDQIEDLHNNTHVETS